MNAVQNNYQQPASLHASLHFQCLIELTLLEVILDEVLAARQDTHQLALGVAEVGLGFEAVRVDGPLVINSRCKSFRSDLALVLFLQIEKDLNLRL